MARGDKKKKGPTYDSKELEKGRNLYEEMENSLISMNAQGGKFTQFQKKMVSNYATVAKAAHQAYKDDQMSKKEFQSRLKYVKMAASEETSLSDVKSEQVKLSAEIARLDAIGHTAAADKHRTNLALLSVKGQQLKVEQASAEMGKEMVSAMGEVGSTMQDIFSKGLLAGAITAAFMVLTSFMKTTDEIGNKLGAAGVPFQNDIMGAGAEMQKLGYSTEDAMTAAGALSNNFGVSYDEALALAPAVGELSKSLGMSVDEGAKLLGTLTEIGGLTPEQAEDLAKSAESLAVANGIAPSAIMKEVAGNTETFAKFAVDGGENIVKAAAMAKKLGTNLDTVAKVSSGLLDFQSSLNKEIEVSAMLGKNINFQKARELALNNDIEGAMQAVLDQVGSEEEFNKMNALQRQALADSIGVGVDEMAKFVGKSDEALGLSDQIAGQKGFEELAGEDAISSMASLTNELKSTAATLVQTLGPALNMIFKTMNLLLTPVKAVIGFFAEFGTAAKVVSGIMAAVFLPQIVAGTMATGAYLLKKAALIKTTILEGAEVQRLALKQLYLNTVTGAGNAVTLIKNTLTKKSIALSGLAAVASMKEAVKAGIAATANVVKAISGFFSAAASGSAATLGFGTPVFMAMAALAVGALLGAMASAPRFESIQGTTDAANVKSGVAIADANESIVDTDKLGDAVDGGGGNIDITPIVMAIQGLQGDVVAMKTELKTSIDSSSKTIASEVVTGMDKATG